MTDTHNRRACRGAGRGVIGGRVVEGVWQGGAPLPEPVALEEEGAVLNGHRLGLHKQQSHQDCLHNHTDGKEQEGAPLQQFIVTSQPDARAVASQ